jgi:hypothetical protein
MAMLRKLKDGQSRASLVDAAKKEIMECGVPLPAPLALAMDSEIKKICNSSPTK